MNISLVIAQVKSLATVFAGNVAGAAEYANGAEDQAWLPMPAAYVIPLEEEAEPNQSMNGLYQISREQIGIVVVLDNTADRRGQAASATLDQVKKSIFTAILNWRPDSSVDNQGQVTGDPEQDHEARGFYLVRGGLIDFNRARLFYQIDFALDVTFTDADGWQIPAPQPLTEIQATFTGFGNVTVIGNTLKGSTRVFNVPNVTNLAVGMSITGPGIPANTTIAAPAPDVTGFNLSKPATLTSDGSAIFTVTPATPTLPTFDIIVPQ